MKRGLLALTFAGALLTASCGGDSGDTVAVDTSATDGTTTTLGNGATDTTASDKSTSSGVADFLAKSAESTADASTGEMAMSFVLIGVEDEGGADVELMTFAGVFDDNQNAFAMSADMSGFAALGAAAEDLGPFADAFDDPIEMIQIGDDAYIKMGIFSALFGGDSDTWIKTTADSQSDFGGDQFDQADPDALLALLRSGGDDVEELGTETIDGVTTIHFRGSFSAEEAMADATPQERAELESIFPVGGLSQEAFVVDVWIGEDDGLVRRMEMTIELDELSSAFAEEGLPASAGFKISVELTALGEPVTIEAPPADKVVDESEMFGGFGDDS